VEPRLIRAVIAGGRRRPVPRKVVQRPISAGTAAVLTEVMEQVVERGTAKAARIPGFTVAGKTGTAKKVVNGRYSASEFNASFVGFVPSRQPVFAIVVVIDSPHGRNSYYGGTVAAPIFQRIASAGLRLYGVPQSINPAPPVLVVNSVPPLQQPVSVPSEPPAIVPAASPTTDAAVLPDVRGMSARDALRILAGMGVTARLHGVGMVVEQAPDPGTPIQRGIVSTLRLERQDRPQAAAVATSGHDRP
jgi:membrane peptidoglycan carboxypeptidase